VSLDLETMNKLYLELSQFVTAKTAREIELESALSNASLTPMWYCPICLHIMNECQSKHYAGCPTDKHGILEIHLAQHVKLDLASLLSAAQKAREK
jgi:hypothetical protein